MTTTRQTTCCKGKAAAAGTMAILAVAIAASVAAPAFARSNRARRVLDALAGLILLAIAIPIFRQL